MTHKLIKTDNYLLVVDNSEINTGDYYYSLLDSDIYKNYGTWETIKQQVENYDLKKIAAHLPLNGSPVLEGVDLLPALEDDVDKLAKEYFESKGRNLYTHYNTMPSFKDGYNKAREKYKYTEEDVSRAYYKGAADCHDKCTKRTWRGVEEDVDIEKLKLLKVEFIQSLHQYPTEFISETERYTVEEMSKLPPLTVNQKPKTTTINGRRTWVGKYK